MGGLHAGTRSALVTTAGWRRHAGCHLVGKKRKSGKTGMGKYVSICPWCKGREWREVVKSQKSLISGRKCCLSHMSINPLHSGVPQSAPSKAGSSWTASPSDHHRLNPNSIFPSDFMSCLWLVVGLLIVFTHLKGWIFLLKGFSQGQHFKLSEACAHLCSVQPHVPPCQRGKPQGFGHWDNSLGLRATGNLCGLGNDA